MANKLYAKVAENFLPFTGLRPVRLEQFGDQRENHNGDESIY